MNRRFAPPSWLLMPNIKPPVPWGIGFGLLVAVVVSIAVEVLLLDIAETTGVYSQSTSTNLAELVFSSTALLAQIAVALALVKYMAKKNPFRVLNFQRIQRRHITALLKVLGVYIGGLLLVIGPLMELILSPELLDETQDIGLQTSALPPNELLLTGLVLVILVPVAEEVMYRGILFRGLATKLSNWTAAIISGGLFALFHLQVNVAIDTFFLSLLLCLLYARTQNLWLPIGLHAVKNGLAFGLLLTGVA